MYTSICQSSVCSVKPNISCRWYSSNHENVNAQAAGLHALSAVPENNVYSDTKHCPDARTQFASSAKTRRFQAIYDRHPGHKTQFSILMLAAHYAKTTAQISPLIWQSALTHDRIVADDESFTRTFRRWRSMQETIKSFPITFGTWRHAFVISIGDNSLFADVLQLAELVNAEGSSKVGLYDLVMRELLNHVTLKSDVPTILSWHETLLSSSLTPNHRDRQSIFSIMSTLSIALEVLYGLFSQFRQHNLQVSFYATFVGELAAQNRFVEARMAHDFLCERNDFPVDSKSCEDLLAHLVELPPSPDTREFIDDILRMRIVLTSRTSQLLAHLHARNDDLNALFESARSEAVSSDHRHESDQFWAAALMGAKTSEKQRAIMSRMRRLDIALGPLSVQACIDTSTSASQLQSTIRIAIQRGIKVQHRAFAALIRHLSKAGEVKKAKAILMACLQSKKTDSSVSKEDAAYMRRNLLLGLLEGQHYSEFEACHTEMVVDNTANATTWNLLVRSRLVDSRVDEARYALEEMRIQGYEAENATTHEFMSTVLRYRRPGRKPDVSAAVDRRPYLADIVLAIKIGHQCMQMGGRVQPETWREVMKRLSLYGEFEALDKVADWLITQYQKQSGQETPDADTPAPSRVLPLQHQHHPLRRLFWQRDIGAIITRGFWYDKAQAALKLVVKWNKLGVDVDRGLIEKQIRSGFRYRATNQNRSMAEERRLLEALLELAQQIT